MNIEPTPNFYELNVDYWIHCVSIKELGKIVEQLAAKKEFLEYVDTAGAHHYMRASTFNEARYSTPETRAYIRAHNKMIEDEQPKKPVWESES